MTLLVLPREARMSDHCTCEPDKPSDWCRRHNPGYECPICGRDGMTHDRLMDHWFTDHTEEELAAYDAALQGSRR
jgi:hypothetical protein